MSQVPKKLTFWPLVGALYFMVSGGPFGLEELVQKLGFAAGLVCLLVTPVVWSLPTALLVGELGSSLPVEGGYYAWVRRGLGPFWGFQEAWLSLAASVFDMAIYPTLFVAYFGRVVPIAPHFTVPLELAFIAIALVWNLRGARVVGEGAVLLTVLLLAPFVVLTVVAFAHPHAAPAPPPVHGSDWLGGILIAMWNYLGWDHASTVAGEVDQPGRIYSRACFVAVTLVTLTYTIPVASVWAAGIDPAAWTTGAWVDAAQTVGGRSLAVAMAIAGCISAFGLWSALLLSYSRVPPALAKDGYLPRVLTRHSGSTGAPHVSVVVCAVVYTLSLGLSFERLVILDVLFYGASLVLEFVALARLRTLEPGLERPYRVPLARSIWLLGVFPTLLTGVAIARNVDETMDVFGAHVPSLVFGLGVMALGAGVYALERFRMRSKNAENG